MKKLRVIGLALAAFLAIGLVSCGGGKTNLPAASEGEVPEWYNNPPTQDPNVLVSVKSATSRDKQLATDKALQDGRAEIAKQIEIKVQGLEKRFQEETGIGEDSQLLDQFTKANKTIVNQTLNGSKMTKSTSFKEGNVWRSYVLVECNLGAAKAAMLAQIKANEQLYTKVRASQTFDELNKEIEKMEKK